MKAALILSSILIYIVTIVLLWRHRKWLLFYMTASFGFTLTVVFGGRYIGVENSLEAVEVFLVQKLSVLLGIGSQVIGKDLLQISTRAGSALLEVNIECSALIEMAVLTGLVLFYPGFKTRRKIFTIIVGLIFTFAVNIIRIQIITLMIYFFGSPALFWAHAVVARLFFFITVIIFYWFLLTKPSLKEAAKKHH